MSKHVFSVPDYYPAFSCKCAACRQTCCKGWNISITMQEYFHLLGMNCSPALRRRLDTAFHPADHPEPHRYAVITPNWRGECPLLDEDGLCILQKECGENAMSGVCRYYPRTPKSRFGYTCTLTGSCERVLELLYDKKEPVHMIPLELTWDIDLPAPDPNAQLMRAWQQLRLLAFDILQNRMLSLPARLETLSCHVDQLMAANSNAAAMQLLEAIDPADLCRQSGDFPTQSAAFCAFLQIIDWLCDGSQSMEDIWLSCRAPLQLPASRLDFTPENTHTALRLYQQKAAEFARLYPQWETYYENLLINHLLDDDYPFSERHEDVRLKQEAMNLTYALLRFFGVMYADGTRESLVDLHAACFHLIEHSNFDALIPRMAARLNLDENALLAMTQF
ncbi:MAG: flagellin lysine-N-methylase [Clostridia bacterium]|nr:flagellin lysine-N-methylase [Clostridia bacterium]